MTITQNLTLSAKNLIGQKPKFTLCILFDEFVKTREWWAVVDSFRQIHEMRTVIICLPSDAVVSLF